MITSLLSSTAKLRRIVQLVQAGGVTAMFVGAALVVLGVFQVFATGGGIVAAIVGILGAVVFIGGWRVMWIIVRLRGSAGLLRDMMRMSALNDAASRARKVN